MKKLLSLFIAVLCLQSCSNEEKLSDDKPSGSDLFTVPKPVSPVKTDDEYYFNYRLEAFAQQTEPLIGETFGNALTFEQNTFWEHAAYTSCAVGFATNLPTLSIIEYGETGDYGHTTTQSESYYYQHLHYLRDLKEGATYHYRIWTMGHDGAVTSSEDRTFTTKNITKDIIRIPQDLAGQTAPPYVLSESNKTYVLTRDIDAPTLGINMKVSNITLELDGHTITYDNAAPKVAGSAWNDYAYNEEATFGIRAGLWNLMNLKLYNGIVRQGRNGGAGFVGIGFNPVFFFHTDANTRDEIAGITVDYYGASVGGIVDGNGKVHHNVLYDRGTVIDDRHMGVLAISTGSKAENELAYNSVRRFRHQGHRGGGNIHHNEMYSDSFDTNSFMIAGADNAVIEDNKLFGMGYNCLGIGWANHLSARRNFIYLHGFAPSRRSNEYDRNSGVSGMRLTNYDGGVMENMLFENNVIVLKAEDGCTQARGIWTANHPNMRGIVYRRNTVKVEAMPGNVKNTQGLYYNGDVNNAVAAITVNCDKEVRPPTPLDSFPAPIIFEDNHLMGNVNLVMIGEGYGISNSVWLYRTKLERISHDSEYFRPVRLGFWYWNTSNNRMIDTELIGISERDMLPHFYGDTNGYMEISYGLSRTLLLTNASNAPLRNMEITVATANRTMKLRTDNEGKLNLDVLTVQYVHKGSEKVTNYEAYTLSAAGYKAETVTVSQLKMMTALKLMYISS